MSVSLDDQILSILRDEGPETTRYVVMRLNGFGKDVLLSTLGNRPRAMHVVEARVGSLRRRGLLAATGKSPRDHRQNTYALTARARRLAPAVGDLPPLNTTARLDGDA